MDNRHWCGRHGCGSRPLTSCGQGEPLSGGTLFKTGRYSLRWVTTAGLCLSLAACAQGPRRSLSFVPQLPWQQKESVADGEKGSGEAVAQANAPARSIEHVSDPFAGEDLFATSKTTDSPQASQQDVVQEVGPVSEVAEADELTKGTLLVSAEASQERERAAALKAALSADAARIEETKTQASASHPLRVRADSLLRKAESLLAAGDLLQARRAAELAVEISESSGLDYLPTEVRPLDLLHKIEQALRVQHEAPVALESLMPEKEGLKLLENSLTATDGPNAVERGHSTGNELAPGSQSTLLRPSEARLGNTTVGWQGQTTEAVVVAANRPVTRREQTPLVEAALESTEPQEKMGMSGGTVIASAGLSTPELPLPELPSAGMRPFSGSEAVASAVVEGPTLSLPEVAPPPPEVEGLQFPSATTVSMSPVPVTPAPGEMRPLFSSGAVLWAIGALGVIGCVVGLGLIIRAVRERWLA